jgi:propanol-preferring alcohol dehydrogenase
MKAMVLNGISDLDRDKSPLELTDVPLPVPGEREILVKITR